VSSYLLAGIEAAVFGWLIGGVFRLLMTLDPGAAVRGALERYPWACISFVTAAGTSFLIDDVALLPKDRLRWLEAAGLAVANAAAGIVAHAWLLQVSKAPVPSLWVIIPSCVAIGGAIGYLIPTWYRDAPRRPERTRIRRVLEARREEASESVAASETSARERPVALTIAPRYRPALDP
jgi:hypothetical protein